MDSTLLSGLYFVGIQATAVVALVYIVVALMGWWRVSPLTNQHAPAQSHPRRD